MTIEQFRLAGLATGLTALLGELDPATSSPLSDDASIHAHIDEQRDQVRVRVERFRALKERVVVALADADVPAVFVKGAELIDGVWSHPSARPDGRPRRGRGTAPAGAGRRRAGGRRMHVVDLDPVRGRVPRLGGRRHGPAGRRVGGPQRARRGPSRVARVRPRLRSDRVRRHRCGATDRRPAPPSARRPHRAGGGASGGDGGARRGTRPQRRRHVVLRSTRCRLAGRVAAARPSRSAARRAGLWLVDRLLPGMVPDVVVGAQMRRLPAPARALLHDTEPQDVFRDPTARTDFRWRQAFAIGPRERFQVVEQMVWPEPAPLDRGNRGAGRRTRPGHPAGHVTGARRLRIVVVMPPVLRSAPAEALAAMPTVTMTLDALAASDAVDVAACFRTHSDAAVIERNGIVHRFEPSDRAVVRAVRDLRPDVVHVHGLGFVTLLARLCRSLDRHVAIVVQHHGEPPGPWRNRQLHRLVRRRRRRLPVHRRRRRAGRAVPRRRRARTTVARLRRVGGRQHPASRRMSAGDRPRRDMLLEGSPAVLWVGRLIAGKDPLGAVDAVAAALQTLPDVHLHMLASDSYVGRRHERARGEPRRRGSRPSPSTGTGARDAPLVRRRRRAAVDQQAGRVELLADRGDDTRVPARGHRHRVTSFDHP